MEHPTTAPLDGGVQLARDEKTGELRARQFEVSVVSGPDAGKRAPLQGVLRIGSSPDVEFPLTDPTVSRQHLELEVRPDGVRVRDLGSSNGTFVSGARIQEAMVPHRATLTAGKTVLRISYEETTLETPAYAGTSFGPAIGASVAMRRLFGLLDRVAKTDATVVLLGETGTGKEVLAEAIHQASPRAKSPFVHFDCGAVAPSLIESELFGHVKGAFTGAATERQGAFLRANGGTIFLDEVGELPLELQPRLLRALESRTVKRLGDDAPRDVDVRVIAATHRDLEAMVKEGKFREDLFFRLAVVQVRVPPLRERPEDVPLLARHFVKQLGHLDVELSAELLERLSNHSWPGNVREVRNVVTRVIAGGEDAELAVGTGTGAKQPPRASEDVSGLPFKEAKEKIVDAFTREYLSALLERCGGNVSEVSRIAGLARSHVHTLVARYGLKGH